MKQKLMVAMALLHRPEALLLDEPLTGLDPPAMRRMKDRIRDTAASGVAVILSSHMLHLVEELCRAWRSWSAAGRCSTGRSTRSAARGRRAGAATSRRSS